ncbi:MAG: ABC transporter ATP-binding protein, partial [Oscillospiraceae bacterium]
MKKRNIKNDLTNMLKNLAVYLAPYKWSFWGSIFMMVLTIIAITIAPSLEGMVTTQLAKDAKDILQGTAGAGVHLEIILVIIL